MRRLLSHFELERALEIKCYDALEFIAVICFCYALILFSSMLDLA